MNEGTGRERTEEENRISRGRFLRGAGVLSAGLAATGLVSCSDTDQAAVAQGEGAAAGGAAAGTAASSDGESGGGRFADRVVLVTGATSGIGRRTAERFAAEGARVVFCGRREDLGREVEQGIRGDGGEATYVRADVREEDQVRAFVDAAIERYGRVDIAFNNAGIETRTPGPIPGQALDEFVDVMTTNAVGYFLSMKYELPRMVDNEPWGAFGTRGVIVNNASVSGHDGFATIAPYSASKHAVVGLTKCAALEFTGEGIRINSISPGGVDTPMLRRAVEDFGQTLEEAGNGIPIGRVNTTDEMANIVMYLSSDEASSVVGNDVDVTGGMLAS